MYPFSSISFCTAVLACLGFLMVPTTAAASLTPATVAASVASAVAGAPLKRKKRKKRRRKKRKKKPAAETPAKGEDGKAADADKDDPKAAPAKADPSGESNLGGLRRSNQMEFDARLVTGETAQSGAVYLFQRAPRQLPPLVKLRQSYLRDIVDPVLGAMYQPTLMTTRIKSGSKGRK